MMMGLEAPGPGISVFQARFALLDQAVGAALAETPAPAAPRNRGQSSATAWKQKMKHAAVIAKTRRALNMFISVYFKECGLL